MVGQAKGVGNKEGPQNKQSPKKKEEESGDESGDCSEETEESSQQSSSSSEEESSQVTTTTTTTTTSGSSRSSSSRSEESAKCKKKGVSLANPAVPNSPRFISTRELIAKQQKRIEERKGQVRSPGSGGSGPLLPRVLSGRRKFRRKQRPLTICLSHCRYDLVRATSQLYGLIEVTEDTAWNIYWTDYSVSLERAVEMRRFQIVNHFPGMNEICRKDLLARNLNRMKRVFPEEYNIYPMTWCLPADNNELQAYSQSRRGKTYICKPEMGCQGRGIFLVKNLKDLNPFGRIICQVYIQKPFLIDHLKFDLRIYVLITSCDPLRVYVYKEGLARFATAKYRQPTQNNTENSYMHLTNYAVNKFSRDFVVDEEAGTKRKLTTVYNWLEQRGYDLETLEKNIDDVIMKTILSAQPILKHHYRTCFPHHDICSACFEILGFDILIDQKLKPFVIEVNHSPSFHTDTKLDHQIKESLLQDTFAMLHLKQLDRFRIEREDRKRVQERLSSKVNDANRNNNIGDSKNNVNKKIGGLKGGKDEGQSASGSKGSVDYSEKAFAWEMEHRGGYRLIYPLEDYNKYDKFLAQNTASLYQATAASEARANLTRVQMDEYNTKKLQEEQKRHGGAKEAKEKLRPESATSNSTTTNNENSKSKKKKLFVPNSLLPVGKGDESTKGWRNIHIVSEEECDRVKNLMQRGMLIRSLGIELQVYNLLTVVGNLKKSEHDDFRRKHGFTLPGHRPIHQQTQSSRLEAFTYPSKRNSKTPSRQETARPSEPLESPLREDSTPDLTSSPTLRGNSNPGGHRKEYLQAKLANHQSKEHPPKWQGDKRLKTTSLREEEAQMKLMNDPLMMSPPRSPYARVYSSPAPSGFYSTQSSKKRGSRDLPTGAAQVRAITKSGPDIGAVITNGTLLNRNAREIQRRYDVVHDRKLVNALSALRHDLSPNNPNKGDQGQPLFPSSDNSKPSSLPKPPKTANESMSARRWIQAASMQMENTINPIKNRQNWSSPSTNEKMLSLDESLPQGPTYPVHKIKPREGLKTPLGRFIPNYGGRNQVLGASGPSLESAAVIFPRRGNNKVMSLLNNNNPSSIKKGQSQGGMGGDGEVGALSPPTPVNKTTGADNKNNSKEFTLSASSSASKEKNYEETALFLKGFHISPRSVGLTSPLKLHKT